MGDLDPRCPKHGLFEDKMIKLPTLMDRARTLLYVTSLSFTAMLQILETRQVLFDWTNRSQELRIKIFVVTKTKMTTNIWDDIGSF